MSHRLNGFRWLALTALALGFVVGGTIPQDAMAREIVAFRDASYPAGTIVVRTAERHLYYVMGDGHAVRYPVGVGKAGKAWAGRAMIDSKHLSPAWSPPADVKRDNPHLPDVIPGGSPKNPMGAAALTLNVGQYAIHGTNVPSSIGGFVSYGCIRMYNQDVLDLYGRVSLGTSVIVTR
jgi:lipoprotein-anchoring transpeptidase ErfK/SrfK